MEKKMKYIDRIKEAIKSEPTQEAVAHKMSVSASYLSDVLNGKRPVSLAMAMKLEEHYGVNGVELMKEQVEAEFERHG
jgi:transcriptional regulator with XRE-family HTH domain